MAPGAVRRLVLVNPMIGPGGPSEGSKRDFATGYVASISDFADAWKLAGRSTVGRTHGNHRGLRVARAATPNRARPFGSIRSRAGSLSRSATLAPTHGTCAASAI